MVKLIINRLWQTITDDNGDKYFEIDGIVIATSDEDLSPINNSLAGRPGPELIITYEDSGE